MLGCLPTNTQIDPNHELKEGVIDHVDRERYQRLIGKLIYLSHTWPVISYVVSVVSRYMHNPRVVHHEVVDLYPSLSQELPYKGLLIEKNEHMRIEVL
jgi:hypothetical protein